MNYYAKQTQTNPILSAIALAKADAKPPIFDFICFQVSYRIWVIIVRHKRMNRKLIKINSLLAAIALMVIFVNRLVYLGGLVL